MSTISVYVVGDGVREKDTLATIAGKAAPALSAQAEHFERWHDVRVGKGFDGKLLYCIRRAQQLGLHGVIAVVDQDREDRGARLKKLIKGREDSKRSPTKGTLPCAIGEARPHAEAWLLDDGKAVRETLGMAAGDRVPSVRSTKNPKGELDALMNEHLPGSDKIKLLGEIAERLDPTRCNHASETGLEDFLDDVEREFAA